MSLEVTGLTEADRPRWTELWHGYLDFYHTTLPDETYDRTWGRLLRGEGVHGLAARSERGIVGIAHYLFHAHCWTEGPACYLQDLYVDADARGLGAGRALIEAVAAGARTHGADRMYWQTQDHNATARLLYDRVAKHNGFIRYDYPL